MSTLEQIRAAIVATLTAVPDIGRVHDYERYTKQNSDFVELYKDRNTGRINGWNVRRTAKKKKGTAPGFPVITTTWRIRGFMAISDADESEKIFDAQIEKICAAFDTDPTLGGVVDDATPDTEELGVQLDESGPVMFAGVLCHGASLRLITIHYQETA